MRRLVLMAVLSACRIKDVDYTGKACPCPSGYVCDEPTQTCQRTATPVDMKLPIDMATTDAPPLQIGLLYWYHLDDQTGSELSPAPPTTADAYIHNTLHVTRVVGKQGIALHFDGTEGQSVVSFPADHAPCATPPIITSSFTVSAWVMFDSFHPFSYSLGDIAMIQGTDGGTEGGWGLGATDGCDGTSVAGVTITTSANDSLRATRCGGTQLVTGRWYFLTGVYDAAAKTLDIYQDGAKNNGAMVNAMPISSSINSPPDCAMLGSPSNGAHMLYGAIDEVRVYTRALSAAEVHELFLESGGT